MKKISWRSAIRADIIFRNRFWPARPILLFCIRHKGRAKRYCGSFIGILRHGSLCSLLKLRY